MNRERLGYIAANLLLLTAALLIALALNGCHNPYEIAKRRFATDVVDTSYTNVVTTVPRDSAVLVFKTITTRDTTRIVETVRQGRATVTYIREPTNTTVIANCDSVYKTQPVATRIVKQVWGVDPKFKDNMQTWRAVALLLIGLLLIGVGAFLLTYKFKLAVAKR